MQGHLHKILTELVKLKNCVIVPYKLLSDFGSSCLVIPDADALEVKQCKLARRAYYKKHSSLNNKRTVSII